MPSQPPSTPGTVADVPVNVAPPNWQCPHCLTRFGRDLEAATACAQAGPPPPVTEGTPVLILRGHTAATGSGAPVLGLTEVGPVKPVTVDGHRYHRRNVVVAGEQVDADRLTSAPTGKDGLHLVTDTRHSQSGTYLSASDLSRFGDLAKLFLGKDRWGEYRDTGVTVWVQPPSGYERSHRAWWRAPDEDQRAALNVVTAGLLDTIADTDEADLATAIRGAYSPDRRSYHPRLGDQRPVDIAGPAGGLMVADAHGAPNHIWALRWLTAHLDAVAAWQAAGLRAWAAGDEHALLPAATGLRIPEKLPKNPGKRRLSVMEPYGDSYTVVRDTVTAQLVIDAPTNPVPGVGDVEAIIRATHEGN